MKKNLPHTLILSSLFLLILSACGTNAIEVEPTVVFENEYAEVVKVSLDPGEFLSAHAGTERVIYALTDYAIEWEEQGENLGTKSWNKGDAHFHEAGEHAAKNNGTTTAEWLVFAKKDAELPECPENTLEYDVNTISPEFTKLLLDNDYFRLTEVTLPPDNHIPLHVGINRIIYSLTDYQVLFESDQNESGEKQFKAGDVHWHEACQHSLENNGDVAAKYLVASYKN